MTTAAPASEAPVEEAPAGSVPAPRALLGGPVIWAGIALGTAVTVLAVLHGIRLPGLQVVLSVALTWLLLIVVAVTVAELLRRHHRAIGPARAGGTGSGVPGSRAATPGGAWTR